MKIVGYEPKEKQINKNDVIVDISYDRKQRLYAICLKDKNTGDTISDYEYARDKEEAQFTKQMMLDDIRNYLDYSYTLIESNDNNNLVSGGYYDDNIKWDTFSDDIECEELEEALSYVRLYHKTAPKSALSIINQNTLKKDGSYAFNFDKGKCVCLSRDYSSIKNNIGKPTDVVFVINRSLLNSDYKITPVSDYKNSKNLHARKQVDPKAEEVVFDNIENLNRYVDKVIITDDVYDAFFKKAKELNINNLDKFKFIKSSEYKVNENLREDLSQEVDSEENPLTPEQVEFFKNSKVRDNQGRLLVVYHGTEKGGFNSFKQGSAQNGNYGSYGIFFSSNRDVAKTYIDPARKEGEEYDGIVFDNKENRTKSVKYRNSIYACYLSITNPFIIDCDGRNALNCQIEIDDEMYYTLDDICAYADEKGYDGVIAKNIRDVALSINNELGNDYITFNSNQIKSIDNKNPSNSNNINEELIYDNTGLPIRYFNSPYQVKDYLLSRDNTQRIFIDKKLNVYLICSAYDLVHMDTIKVAKESAILPPNYKINYDDWKGTNNIAIILYVPNDCVDFNETEDGVGDGYEYKYVYDNFEIYSRSQNFSNFELSSILGNYKSLKLKYSDDEDDDYNDDYEWEDVYDNINSNLQEDYDYDKIYQIKELYKKAYDELIDNSTRLYRYREWASNSNNDYKEYIYNDLKNNKKDSALNLWYNHYRLMIGNYDLSYEDFLNTPITLYRATNVKEDENSNNPFFSYAQDKRSAERFLSQVQNLYGNRSGEIKEIQIKPKDTLGMLPSDENEIIVPNNLYQKRISNIENIVNEVINYANKNNVELPYDRDELLNIFKKEGRDTENFRKHMLDWIDKRKGKLKKSKLKEDNNYGYHAGDLGKSEGRQQQDGGRNTGHFGTGTYFVSNEDKIKNYNDYQYGKGKAPHHIVDFSSYNLYKPSNNDKGYDLHDTLRLLNNGYKYFTAHKDDLEWFKSHNLTARRSGEFEGKDIPEIVEHLNNLIGEYDPIELPKDINYNTIDQEEDEVWDKYYDELKPQYKDKGTGEFFDAIEDKVKENPKFVEYHSLIKTIREAIEEELDDRTLSRFSEYNKLVSTLQNALENRHSKEEIEKALNKVNDNLYSKVGDSLSTIFMKALGYEGIDVRHLQDNNDWAGLDNTTYGSVIYDVKPETIVENVLQEAVMPDRIRKLIDKAYDICEKSGYDFSNPQTFKSDMLVKCPLQIRMGNESIRKLGEASYPRNDITEIRLMPQLNQFQDDDSILSVILHELGHIIAYDEDFDLGYVKYDGRRKGTILVKSTYRNRLSHHGKRWQNIVAKLSKESGLPIQRLANAEDSAEWQDINQDKYKYVFECPECRQRLKYTKETQFVKEYNKFDENGSPLWWCGNCSKKNGKKIQFVKVDKEA